MSTIIIGIIDMSSDISSGAAVGSSGERDKGAPLLEFPPIKRPRALERGRFASIRHPRTAA